MRILMVAESTLPAPSDTVSALLRSAASLRAQGHEVAFVRPPGLGGSSALRRAIREFAPDVVHAAAAPAGLARTVAAARTLDVPVITQDDAEAVPEPGARRRVPLGARSSGHAGATLALAPSRAAVDALRASGVHRVAAWEPGVDTELFSPTRRNRRVRTKLRGGRGTLLVGYVGRLSSEKQVEDLRVLQSLPHVKLVLVGQGPDHVRLAETLHRAIFVGHREGVELAEHVASLDVLVHPGENEAFGRALQEAMASGVATVAVGRGGPLDLVENGTTGLHYEPGNLGQLRRNVEDLQNPELRHRLADAGYALAQTRSWEAMTSVLEDHYRTAITLHGQEEAAPARVNAASQNTEEPRPAAELI